MSKAQNRILALFVLGGLGTVLVLLLWMRPTRSADPEPARPVSVGSPAERPSTAVSELGSPPAEAPAAHASDAATEQATTPRPSIQTAATPDPEPVTRIRGRIVDERTEEPVPDLTVTLSAGGSSETVSTDSGGAFRAVREVPLEALVVEIADLGTPIARLEQDVGVVRGSDLGTIRVRIGPTIPLEIEGEVSICTARVVESARPSGVAGIIDVDGASLSARTALRGRTDLEWPWIKVRSGHLPWIRYPTVPWNSDDRRKPHVEIKLCGSGAEGVGPVASTVGIQPPAKIGPLAESARVSGSLIRSSELREKSRNSNPGAAVLLLPPVAALEEDPGSPLWYEVRPDRDGAFSFPEVRPGSWRLLAHATDHEVHVQDLEVRAGSMSLSPIRLTPSEREAYFDLGPHASASGQLRTFVRMRLAAAGSIGRAWLEPDGIRFWDLPSSTFDMAAIGLSCPPSFRPFVARLPAPPDDLQLHELASSDLTDLEFEARDARTGASLPDLQVSFGPQGTIFGRLPQNDGARWRIARDAPVRWMAWSLGYAPAFGDESAFRRSALGVTAACELQPGWGASLLFRAGDPATFHADSWPWNKYDFPNAASLLGVLANAPIPGIRVEVSEECVATSDAEGEARIALDETPPALVLRCDGWKLIGVESVPGRDPTPQYVVWMDRD